MAYGTYIKADVQQISVNGGSLNTVVFDGTSIDTQIYNSTDGTAAKGVDIYLNDLDTPFSLAAGAYVDLKSHITSVTAIPTDGTSQVDVTIIAAVVLD